MNYSPSLCQSAPIDVPTGGYFESKRSRELKVVSDLSNVDSLARWELELLAPLVEAALFDGIGKDGGDDET